MIFVIEQNPDLAGFGSHFTNLSLYVISSLSEHSHKIQVGLRLKRIFLFPNALFRIQYSSAENTIPGGLHFALFRIHISTTRKIVQEIDIYSQ